jgi:NAD(P)-dependent dehydrogenase (short-subunit alcohol dehydrogenase family)
MVAKRIGEECGRLDILVNNAGIMTVRHESLPIVSNDNVQEIQKALWSEDQDGWAKQFEVNITSVYFTTIACLELLRKSNEYWESLSETQAKVKRTAQVITVTGIAAHAKAMRVCMGYSASKAGVLHLMRSLSTVLTPLGIRFV